MTTRNVQNSQTVVTTVGSPKEPGLLYREVDSPGAGHLMAEPIDSPRNMAKGNVGYGSSPEPRAVSHVPFVIEED